VASAVNVPSLRNMSIAGRVQLRNIGVTLRITLHSLWVNLWTSH